MTVEVARGTGALRPLTLPGRWWSVGGRFAHVAAAVPDAVALASAGRSYTYAQLRDEATDRARALRRRLADEPPQRPVALAIEPTADCVAALLAVVLAGRTAVPLDPLLPPARVGQILDASGAVRLDVAGLHALPAGSGALPDAGLDDPAVTFYTSGSTGRPKGVVHSHGSWLNQAYCSWVGMDLRADDRHALILPLSFGAGLDVLFFALLTGAGLYVHDPRVLGIGGLADTLAANGVTAIHGTPALLRSLLDGLPAGRRLDGVRLVTSCGEAIHASLVERVRAHLPGGSTFVGLSGASEIGSLAFYPLPPGRPVPPGFLPVGRPAANKIVEVVDAAGAPVGPGVTGEVTITSRYLALGYHDAPELTAQRYRRNPDGTTTYRGGDLGRFDDAGDLHLRGRLDAAVKVGAYLVEPAEVEAALLDLPTVAEAVVSAVRDAGPDGGRARLIAHVVPVPAERPLTPAAVRRALRERLPSWMVPGRIVLLAALPRNDRGKIDRPALPAPDADQPFVGPRTLLERRVAGVWQAVLGLDEVPVGADFWELGADSLAVEQLIVAIRGATGTTLTSADLTGAPTVERLAALLADRSTTSVSQVPALPPTAVRLRRGTGARGTGGPPVFAFAGGGAAALSLLPIATALRADVPVYGFQAAGYESRGLPDWRLRDVVTRHLATMRRIAPHGPYVLVGHSFGGLLALEAAARLAAAGEPVPLVVLLDTVLPDAVAEQGRGRAAPGARGSVPQVPAPPPPLGERLRMHARLLGAGLVRYGPEVRDAVFWEQSLRLVNRHRLTTWGGRTVLFTAPENTDDPAWWDLVLTGPHEVVPIDGGHSSILRPPFHRPVVERLGAELAALPPYRPGESR